jgi:phage shock protein PspC (stress-responsive transcriptional regulator)
MVIIMIKFLLLFGAGTGIISYIIISALQNLAQSIAMGM